MITEIKKNGYVFSVDRDKTSEYYTMHSICNCEGCQNFYKQIDGLFPDLEKFLAEFGVDISRPDEMPWYHIGDHIEYTPYYTVTGNIETMGEHEIDYGNLHLSFFQGGNPETDIPNEQTEAYFFIEVFNITLPWILDIPMPSASGRKNFIMRLLGKFNIHRK